MTIGSIMNVLKMVWETWSLRIIVLLSLSMQALLILLTPLRKRSANMWLIFSVWLAYLLADWAAAFAVGHISYHQLNGKSIPDDNGDLLAFWAPFLLVHLGGPDTISAFALEDNSLWLRHLLNFIFQVCVSIYIFYQTLPKNKLWFPTLLMFLAGMIKYVERILALYLASSKRYEKSSNHDPEGLFVYSVESFEREITDETDVVEYGHKFFNPFFEVFKALMVGAIPNSCWLSWSTGFFENRNSAEAFKVISVELNFLYENLYTKMFVVNSKWGCVFRIVILSIDAVTLVLFTCLNKHQYDIYDCVVSYTLLCGAIGLDVMALLMLIFSDWGVLTIIARAPNLRGFLAEYVFFLKKTKCTTCHIEPAVKSEGSSRTPTFEQFRSKCMSFITGNDKSALSTSQLEPLLQYEVFNTKIWFRRWSESICAYNFLTVWLKLRPRQILKDEKKGLRCIVLLVPRVAVLCFGLICWSILKCCNWLVKALSTGLTIPFDYFTHKLGLREVLDGLKLKSILSYVWKKRVNEDGNTQERCGIIISKLCIFPLYILGLVRYCFNVTIEAIDNGFYMGLIANKSSKAWDTFMGCAAKKLGLDEVLDSMKYVSRSPFPPKLWDFIFDELKYKSMWAKDREMAKRIFEAKGEWVLQDGRWPSPVTDCLMSSVEGEYDGILLQWHIATEVCYNTDENLNTENYEREFSKILSDYMLYLLIKQPTMMSKWIAISRRRLGDTVLEADCLFDRKGAKEDDKLRNACHEILAKNEFSIKGISVLSVGSILAAELRKREDKWKIMSRVWVELLSYAAVHCKTEAHAQALANGGELVTFVWVLMAHLLGHARTDVERFPRIRPSGDDANYTFTAVL